MSERNDGGPAFASSFSECGHNQQGMSLRDWFAGQALAGLLATGDDFRDRTTERAGWEWHAKAAYAQADAMLAERSKRSS